MEAFLASSVPDLISEHAVFEAALLCEESGADGRLLVGLEFIGDLQSLIKLRRVNDGTRMGHYEAQDDRRFAHSSLACKTKRVNGGYEEVE